MSTWPSTLPTAPLLDGFHETVPDTIIRTDMDTGPAKLRQRTTAGIRTMTAHYLLGKTQVDTLEAFYLTTLAGGAYSFDFTHPRSGNVVSCRFASPPEYTAGNGNFFHVALQLEILP